MERWVDRTECRGEGKSVNLVDVRGADQIGILVPDLDTAVTRFSRMFNIQLNEWLGYRYGPATVQEFVYRGSPASYSFRLALGGASPQMELIEVPEGNSFYREWVHDVGYGLHHLGVFVPSLQKAVTAMSSVGVDVLQSGRGYGLDGDGGFAYFDTTSNLGLILEGIEVPSRRRPPDFGWS